MAAKPIEIMKVRQILLLKEKGWSNRKIAQEIDTDRNTINRYMQYFEASDLEFKELLELDESDLLGLIPSKEYLETNRYTLLISKFPEIKKNLSKPGATRKVLWHEYYESAKDPYEYSQFCELFKRWCDQNDVSGKLEHKAGEKLFIDFAGKKLQIVDKETGEIRDIEVFVAILPASQYTYVEACRDQKRESLIKCVGNGLKYFGGVPQVIIPDNLKSAVSKSSKYEPILNKTFRDMGDYYGCVINPTRAYKPQDKALVESAVNLVYQRIYYYLSEMTFFSIDEINQEIWKLLESFNAYKLSIIGISRYKQFIDIEKEHLSPLPAEPYQVKYYNRAKVQKMGYVYLSEQKNYYSVPYKYKGKQVEIRHSVDFVEVFFNGNRIASHKKNYTKGKYLTIKDHLASTHRYYSEWSKDFFVKQALKIGNETADYIARMIDHQEYPEIGYKRAQGIVSLKSYYESDRIEKACMMASGLHYYSFSVIKNILKNKTDLEPEDLTISHQIKKHENIRESTTYQ